jgi:peptidoglycan/LPS O-acetylase OafA/YrhL
VITVHVHEGNFHWLGGNLGVTIFFIISGYLITFLSLREEQDHGRFNLTAFFLRRAFRIFPMYYLTLAIYAVLIIGIRVKPDKIANFEAALPFLAAYLQEVPFFLGINGAHDNIAFYHAWSLGIEEKFYLVWPAVLFVLLRYWRSARLPACICLAAIFAITPYFFPVYGRLVFPYLYILLGCALAVSLDNERIYTRLRLLAHRRLATLVFATLALVHILWTFFAVFPFDHFIDGLYGIVATAFLCSVLLAGPTADRFFGTSLLPFLGRLSYSFYLLHVLCLNAVESLSVGLATNWPTFSLPSLNLFWTILFTFLVAGICSLAIERPMIKIGHDLSRRVLAKRPARANLPSSI